MVLWKFDLLINIKRQHLPVARFSEITSKWQISDKGLFWWHFSFPWVSMTETLTQYDHTPDMCRKHWCGCKENCSIDVFPLLCIWVAYFTILKFKLLCKKMNGVNKTLVLARIMHAQEAQKAPTPHVGIHSETSIAWAVYLRRASTMHLFDIVYLIQLTDISLCTCLKCLWLPYKKKCKNCPQHLTSSWQHHSAIPATVFN